MTTKIMVYTITGMRGDFLIYCSGKALKVGYQKPYRLKYQLR